MHKEIHFFLNVPVDLSRYSTMRIRKKILKIHKLRILEILIDENLTRWQLFVVIENWMKEIRSMSSGCMSSCTVIAKCICCGAREVSAVLKHNGYNWSHRRASALLKLMQEINWEFFKIFIFVTKKWRSIKYKMKNWFDNKLLHMQAIKNLNLKSYKHNNKLIFKTSHHKSKPMLWSHMLLPKFV